MNNPIVHAKRISKIYDSGRIKTQVFENIDLDVFKGDMLTITGTSGTGKSTLLHILGGMDTPDGGQNFIQGQCLQDMSERQRALLRNEKIGFIFQFFHLLPEFTALENVMMPAIGNKTILRKKGKKQIEKDAFELLENVDLADRAHHKPSQLSGGQMQRVAFARAMVNDPVVVFADEPTGNLDERSSEMFIELLNKFNKDSGKTFLIATHNTDLAKIGNRQAQIARGQLFLL